MPTEPPDPKPDYFLNIETVMSLKQSSEVVRTRQNCTFQRQTYTMEKQQQQQQTPLTRFIAL